MNIGFSVVGHGKGRVPGTRRAAGTANRSWKNPLAASSLSEWKRPVKHGIAFGICSG